MAINTRAIVDQWDDIREQLRERWDELADEDLEMVRENVNDVIQRIHDRTGAAKREIQRFLDQLAEEGYSVAERAKSRAAQFASSSAEAARERADRAARRAAEKYRRAEEVVREHPTSSLFAIFGLGCVAGFLLAWLTKSDR